MIPRPRLWIILSLFSLEAWPEAPDLWDRADWNKDVRISEPRDNIYELENDQLIQVNRSGRLHSLLYPVEPTGLKIPMRVLNIFSNPQNNSFKTFILRMAEITTNISSADDLYDFMGLKTYPSEEGEGSYFVPFRDGVRPDARMGITFGDSEGTKYVTASCTACHAESLFGKPVIGLTNKTPRANDTFYHASKIVPKVPVSVLKLAVKTTDYEVELWKKAVQTFKWIGVKKSQVLGLDTSLATVSLSLSKRQDDAYATVTREAYKNPRPDKLNQLVADSKPMPWFTLKYKNRWLSDGSVVSGNPILTNILWNEVGRGVDLKELEDWVETDLAKKQIAELTSAVFATTPPRYTDFFGPHSIDLLSAKRGQKTFNQSCYKCHGTYEKAWDQSDATGDLLVTTEVRYPELTEVKNVGTDPNRWMAMKDLSKELNRLSFSDKYNIKVIPQEGYVPPPLVGIWSRWPYFHNNSAPTLCDVLKSPAKRRKTWYVGSPVDPKTDYDQACNGFPELKDAPKAWQKKERFFDTAKPGLTNTGHSKTDLTEEEITDLVSFLKTL